MTAPAQFTSIVGTVVCKACKGRWIGTAPPMSWGLDCPLCRAHEGYFMLDADDAVAERWRCGCGCGVSGMTAEGLLCVKCGAERPLLHGTQA